MLTMFSLRFNFSIYYCFILLSLFFPGREKYFPRQEKSFSLRGGRELLSNIDIEGQTSLPSQINRDTKQHLR